MKIFLVIMVVSLQVRADLFVDNSVGDVDKDYDHQLKESFDIDNYRRKIEK